MTVDPLDPDTFDVENDVEASDSDAAEQHADVSPFKDDSLVAADPNSADE